MKRVFALPAVLLVVSGCVAGPDPVAPELDTPENFEYVPPDRDGAGLENWYRAFDDPVLVDLVETALANNLDLKEAMANLETARANARAIGADLFPTLDAFVDNQISGTLRDGSTTSTTVSGGLAASFDPDLAGRNKRRTQAAAARVQAAALSAADRRRLVIEAVALEYISLRRSGARMALLDETLELQARTLEIVQARFDAGISPALDVDRAAADLARSRARRGLLEADRRSAAYALGVLTGLAPRSDRFDPPASDEVPAFQGDPDLGVPADLLRNRPDVRRAEALLLVEMALIGVEVADLYPSLRLPGTLSARAGSGIDQVSFSFATLFDLPLLDFGRREAEIDAQEARARAALDDYRQTLLEAQQEVATALAEVGALREQRRGLEEARARSQSAYDQLSALYGEGLASFIDVLDAQRTLIQTREQFVETDAALATALSRLSAALGDLPA